MEFIVEKVAYPKGDDLDCEIDHVIHQGMFYCGVGIWEVDYLS